MLCHIVSHHVSFIFIFRSCQVHWYHESSPRVPPTCTLDEDDCFFGFIRCHRFTVWFSICALTIFLPSNVFSSQFESITIISDCVTPLHPLQGWCWFFPVSLESVGWLLFTWHSSFLSAVAPAANKFHLCAIVLANEWEPLTSGWVQLQVGNKVTKALSRTFGSKIVLN